jgi:DNA-binding transcriptional ArsR family regulator
MNSDHCQRRIIHEDRLDRARELLRQSPDVEEMSDLFKALADRGRVQILMALSAQEMCVCDLAALLEVSESAASHQMRLLRTMNLVKNRRDGQVLYYRLVDNHVTELISIAQAHVAE